MASERVMKHIRISRDLNKRLSRVAMVLDVTETRFCEKAIESLVRHYERKLLLTV